MPKPPPIVLNANDNEGPLYVVSLTLRRAGFEVLEARTGREALELAERFDPDVMVLDVRLPDLDGFEICRRLRSSPKTIGIKVLHTSATFVSLDKKVQSLAGGADGYLTQPFESEELLATVQSLLRLRNMERELRAVAEKLREADRRKNEFLAMLAHELRNPLAAIWAALPVLERNAPRDDAERKARDVLSRQSSQLKRLIDDLLDAARVTQGKIGLRREVVDVTRLLSQVVDNARRTCAQQRRQTLHVQVPEEAVCVRGDPVRLTQVFANLLDNASKYTGEEGSIWVSLRVDAQAEPARLSVEVRDNGVGMAVDTLPHVFSLFAQADVTLARSSGGLGIGLTLVRRLVELHHGSVSAHSEGLGKGSSFRVVLPLYQRQPEHAVPRSPEPTEAPSPSRRILLVEDNEDLQVLLSDLLHGWGHEVERACDGYAGLAKLREFQPEVALIDIGLPGIDGFELARQIRKDDSDAYLIAVTGYSSKLERDKALQCGFQRVLLKPVEPMRLRRILHELPYRLSEERAFAPTNT
jgi:signal transduction histidine kinase